MFPLTLGQLVKVDIEAQHDGARDEAKGWTDGGRSKEETWKGQQEMDMSPHHPCVYTEVVWLWAATAGDKIACLTHAAKLSIFGLF